MKRRHLRRTFKARGHEVLVESGTYLGDTVAYLESHARRIITVELDVTLYEKACRRFAGNDKIEVHHGDALRVIPDVMRGLDAAPLVYLDGHYSARGTARGDLVEPALELLHELGEVAKPGTTILVDDLLNFGYTDDFPSLDGLLVAARSAFPAAKIHTGMNCLVIEA